ncbi:hypothetical protein D3C85_1277900 [compost metagenome]
MLAFAAQDTQRLLHGHARLKQNAQQRNKGGNLDRQFFLPMVGGGGEQAFGQQITDAEGERRDDPRVGHLREEQPLDQRTQGQCQHRNTHLARGEDRAFACGTPAESIEQRLGFVIEPNRLLADAAAAQRLQPLAEAVVDRGLAIQPLHHLASTPTQFQHDTEQHQRCQQKQQRAQQH